KELGAHGLQPPRIQLMPDLPAALAEARVAIAKSGERAGTPPSHDEAAAFAPSDRPSSGRPSSDLSRR
ncbi:MAG TPA: hypothetical protein VHY80_01700, partial [Stellaceae bacterium]|nr:hypothetical protein [Stellaceae bacterium]